MSAKKKNDELPGFKLNPSTGKYVPAALDLRALLGEDYKSPQYTKSPWSDRKKNQRGNSSIPATRKFVLAPLDLRALLGKDYHPQSPWSSRKRHPGGNNTPESHQPHKYKKLEHGVRKELFKQPPVEEKNVKNVKSVRATSTARRSSLSKSGSNKASSASKKVAAPKKGLPTISEVETKSDMPAKENGKKSGYVFKLPEPGTPKELVWKESNMENAKTPGEIEFLRIEEQLKTPKLVIESPVSTVCNLFENKMLIDEEKDDARDRNPDTMEIMTEIRRMVKRDQDLCEDTMKKIKEVEEQQLQHQRNLTNILSLVEKLESRKNVPLTQDSEHTKETSSIKRRSLRLRNKSPNVSPKLASKSDSMTGSPVILKPGDLRKSALTKSLVNNCQKYQIDSPRIRKALDLYNSVKSVGNILLTPKLIRGDMSESSPNSKLKHNLSLKVQQQCLLLQDTPVHKTKGKG